MDMALLTTPRNFLNPARDEDPLWIPVGRFHPECLDQQWIGPPPEAGMQPFRNRTQNIERSWRSLKARLRSCVSLDLVEKYIGEWMYRKNVLDRLPHYRAKFERFLTDIARAYPGVGKEKMSDDYLNCHCHECQ